MEIALQPSRAYLLKESIDWDTAREMAWDFKRRAFGSGLARVFSRPKEDDIKIPYQEKRWHPFWHFKMSADYEYERGRRYRVQVEHQEVKQLLINNQAYLVEGDPTGIDLPVVEACKEIYSDERNLDASTGESYDFKDYLQYPRLLIEDLGTWQPPESIVYSPQLPASRYIREMLNKLVKPLEADVIHKDKVIVEANDLLFHPVYAFQYHWLSKDRFAIVEIDGMNGDIKQDDAAIRIPLTPMPDHSAILDVDLSAVDRIRPGSRGTVQFIPLEEDNS